MHKISFNAILVLASLAIVGCHSDSGNGPFGAPKASSLMTEFGGKWIFDFDKTLAASKAAGVPDEQIAQLRKLYSSNRPLGKMHQDITFDGNVAVGAGLLSSEYRFFGMHKHGSKVCGKAWHHEDRHDPGDMSKCLVRMEIIGGELRLEVNPEDGSPDLNDPELYSEPPVEGDVASCRIDPKTDNDPNVWLIYIFTRSP